jgi:L-rhamnose-H+ transport protein
MDIAALSLIALAGAMQASYPVLMKLTTKWAWENLWLAFTFLGLVLFPGILAILTVPHLGAVLTTSPRASLLAAVLFGLGLGCASVCFGLGVKRLGVSLAPSIIVGIATALGSTIPWLTSPSKPVAYSVLLWCGVLVMLGGVVVCAMAGRRRDARLRSSAGPQQGDKAFWTGLAICIASGVLTSFMNLGLVYGAEVTHRALALGASAINAPNALWLLVMGSGFVANLIYCSYRLFTQGTWQKYRFETARYMGCAVVMALLWEGSLPAYALGATSLGRLGPSVGWGILMSLNVLTSNGWGLATGEWRGAGRRAGQTMAVGIGILLAAVAIFAWATTRM